MRTHAVEITDSVQAECLPWVQRTRHMCVPIGNHHDSEAGAAVAAFMNTLCILCVTACYTCKNAYGVRHRVCWQCKQRSASGAASRRHTGCFAYLIPAAQNSGPRRWCWRRCAHLAGRQARRRYSTSHDVVLAGQPCCSACHTGQPAPPASLANSCSMLLFAYLFSPYSMIHGNSDALWLASGGKEALHIAHPSLLLSRCTLGVLPNHHSFAAAMQPASRLAPLTTESARNCCQ